MSKHSMDDVLVVLPGIMGSTLHRNGKPVWEASGSAVLNGLKSLFGTLKTLQLPAGIGDAHPNDGVTAEDLIWDVRAPLGLWTFDVGYSQLVEFLEEAFDVNRDAAKGPRNLLTFPYDWRLSNRFNGERLRETAERALGEWRDTAPSRADAKLVFICHSMGGLVARWYIDQLGGHTVTRSLITLGTPHRGALNALDQLVNGVRKGIGPFKISLTELGRSLPSTYQLLPEYACIDNNGTLARTTEVVVPEVPAAMVRDAMDFHLQIDAARATSKGAYSLHPIGGFEQRTLTTASIEGSKAVVRTTYPRDGVQSELGGDATVPRLSFAPPDVAPDSTALHFVADNHGGLVHNDAVFDQIEGILTSSHIAFKGERDRLSVEIPETLDPGEALTVRAQTVGGDAPIEVVVANSDGAPVGPPRRVLDTVDGPLVTMTLPAPGLYSVTVRGAAGRGSSVSPITAMVFSWPNEGALLD